MSGQFDSFYALEPGKRQRIIDAALKEFTEKGFKRASTNEIAKNAEIGKGMLFYYFGSKEELFSFLCEYTVEFAKDRYLRSFNFETPDFLERYTMLTEIKRATISEYTNVVAFFESFYRDENAEYSSKYLNEALQLREKVVGNIFDGVDYSLFREDIDGSAIVRYIVWLSDAYQNDVTERVKRGEFRMNDADALSEEWQKFYDFMGDLRKIFYKEGV